NASMENSLYCFNPKTEEWTKLKQTGSIPPTKEGHTECVVGNFMYIFGGLDFKTKEYTNEVFKLNLNTFKWTKVSMNGNPPEARAYSSSLAIGEEIYIFGGYSMGVKNRVYYSAISFFDVRDITWYHTSDYDSIEGRIGHSLFTYDDKIYL